MARWEAQIRGVAPLLDEAFDTENPPHAERFIELRDALFGLLSATPRYDERAKANSDEERWTQAVDEIKYTTDVNDLNEMVEAVYDEADRQRIWIDPLN